MDQPPPPDPSAAPHDKADKGCLLFLFLGLLGVFLAPAILLLGGAPVIVPLLLVFLCTVATPVVNPTERLNPRARWTGRIITWLLMVGTLATAAFLLYRRFFLDLAPL